MSCCSTLRGGLGILAVTLPLLISGRVLAQVDVEVLTRDDGASISKSLEALERSRQTLLEARQAVDDALFEVESAMGSLRDAEVSRVAPSQDATQDKSILREFVEGVAATFKTSIETRLEAAAFVLEAIREESVNSEFAKSPEDPTPCPYDSGEPSSTGDESEGESHAFPHEDECHRADSVDVVVDVVEEPTEPEFPEPVYTEPEFSEESTDEAEAIDDREDPYEFPYEDGYYDDPSEEFPAEEPVDVAEEPVYAEPTDEPEDTDYTEEDPYWLEDSRPWDEEIGDDTTSPDPWETPADDVPAGTAMDTRSPDVLLPWEAPESARLNGTEFPLLDEQEAP